MKKYKAEIAGAVVGTLVTAGCLVLTAGAGSVGCAIAGGAAGAATTNIWKQSQSKKPFDFGSFARDTVMGAAVGWAMGPIASVAGKVLPAVANRLTAAVTSAFKPLASRGGQVASGAVRPPSTPLQSIRPSSGAKPAVSGGGSKPMSQTTSASGSSGGNPTTMYHYTDEAGMTGILTSGRLNPSLKSVNPQDARYGNGQYVSDIQPGTMSCAQLSRCFLGQPFQGQRFTNFVEIDVTGLNVVSGRPGVFVVPGEGPLDISSRIESWGLN